ncbi:hypothetical protein Poly51_32680 [Rubripirellula tenax]|uniref:DUF11 domain-containing protein n=1 Tax=Rubripirellula tenax TaxID=2528015 RepID=A0A5C6F428_9BACT|nr:DUF11 domain-containing protein [Rubripirellula tenax]TWU54549.1 hypothetical protein Poly51_32680 [Rubripirellula tenax]
MKTTQQLTLAIATTAMFAITGCGVTSNQKPSMAAMSQRTPPSSSQPLRPTPNVVAQQATKTPVDADVIAQVGFIGDLADGCNVSSSDGSVETGCVDNSCVSCMPQNACASGGCGCNACQVTPHGYAMPVMPCPTGFDPQEFLCDGGDAKPNAFVRRNDTIGGLDPEDTIAHYTTEAGDIETTASNRVCVYAPRFASVRKITGAVSGGHSIGLATVDRPIGAGRVEINEGGVVIGETIELGHADVSRRIDAMRERNRGVPIESVLQPIQNVDVLAVLSGIKLDQLGQLDDDQRAVVERLALAAVAWTIDESVEVEIQDLKPPTLIRDQTVEGLTVYEFPDAGRLKIVKLADRGDAKPGEIITFAIQVQNVGDSPVEKVTLTDNLTTRLEYVEDSQTCSGGADFVTESNQAHSTQLIWNLTDKLRVGESVTVRFKCKVR